MTNTSELTSSHIIPAGADPPCAWAADRCARRFQQSQRGGDCAGQHDGDRSECISEIAREYVTQPENTLVVSPAHRSRQEINQNNHHAMQGVGQVKNEEHRVRVVNGVAHRHPGDTCAGASDRRARATGERAFGQRAGGHLAAEAGLGQRPEDRPGPHPTGRPLQVISLKIRMT